MINGKSVLAVIPARGGSKSVPRKNIRQVAGKPLIAWTILEAQKSKYIDRLILSSEDDEIIAVARDWNCEVPFVRPVALAQDDIPGIEPVLHAIETLPEVYNYVVLLQPTSPLRTVHDIDRGIEYCVGKGAQICVSVTPPDKSPYWMFVVDPDGKMKPLIDTGSVIARRQEVPEIYALNGAVYVADVKWLLRHRTFMTEETVAFIMDRKTSLDIDDETDLLLGEYLLQLRQEG